MMKYYYLKAFLLSVFVVFVSGNTFLFAAMGNNSKQMVVVIDPGHGGKDPGAISKGIREKDVVLGVGLKLGRLINENFPDVKVVYTRDSDIFVPLIERSKIANKNKADLFISLHANICSTPSTRGTETFILGLHRSDENLDVAKKENSVIFLEEDYSETYEGFDPNLSESYIMFELVQDIYMDQSLLLADAIQQQFKTRIATSNRGVKQAGFLVLRQSSMPSVLVETGFLSNNAEANYLNSDDGQQNIALSILEAFRKFKAKNSGGSAVAPVKSTSQNKQTEVTPKPNVTENSLPEEIQKPKPVVKNDGRFSENEDSIHKTAVASTKSNSVSSSEKKTESNTYYSVQIGATLTPEEPTAANFNGLKDIRREKTDKYYRFYIGKEVSIEQITPIWKQIKKKIPNAFIVSFVDGKRIVVKN